MCQCSSEKDIYLPHLATVNKSRLMNGTELYLRLSMDDGQIEHRPGQFVEVSVPGVGEAPITIASSPTLKDGFELVVRRVGSVTNAIHRLKVGDKLGVRGPYGHGYPVEEMKGQNLVFISGGIGLVPQRAFINYILDNRTEFGDLTVLLGTRCYAQRFFHSELASWTKRTDINFLESVDQVDDCWSGDVGVVTTLIPKIAPKLKSAWVFVCGPPVMYKFVLMSLAEAGVPKERIYLNLERRIRCGVGKCGHCQINNFYVCINGPVFRYSDLNIAPEAI